MTDKPTNLSDPPVDKTALDYWFPILEAGGIPMPKTKIIQATADETRAVARIIYGDKKLTEAERQPAHNLAHKVAVACQEFGFPAFLRTAHTSGKHRWRKNCYVPNSESILDHICGIAEYSELAGFMGLPWYTWVVREFLLGVKIGICPDYYDMPVCKEWRFFVDDGRVRCFHPYWPIEALHEGGLDIGEREYAALCALPAPYAVMDLVSRAGSLLGGSWSVDVFQTLDGGFLITDLAEAEKSFHWKGCESKALPKEGTN